MLDTTSFRALFAVAAARVLADLGGAPVPDDLELAERIDAQLGDLDTIIAAATGTGRTAAGDSLADRLWRELGIEARL